MSTFEQKIINSTEPIQFLDHEVEDITFLNTPSIWLNKNECNSWPGSKPISDFKLNEDPTNVEVIYKQLHQPVEYTQDIQIKYLQPPTPPPHGDLIIQHEKDIILPPLPPKIIRVYPRRPQTPPPLIIREKPPEPLCLPTTLITIPGRVIRPPRQIIIEHMPAQLAKPRKIIIEKYQNLNYLDIEIKIPKQTRSVIHIDHIHNHKHNQCKRHQIWTTSKTITIKPNNTNNSNCCNYKQESSFLRLHENLKRTFWS